MDSILQTSMLSDHRSPCEACALDQNRKPISKQPPRSRATIPNMRVFTDMSGPFTEDGKRILFRPNSHPYIITFIDDCTRHAIWFSMPDKTSASFLYCLEKYMTVVGRAMVYLRSDDAREFDSEACRKFYSTHRIKHEMTSAGSPQLNGVAESNLRTVMAMARKIRLHSGLDPTFGYFAAQAALQIYNNFPTRGLPSGITPYEAWTGKKSDLSEFRVFGCRCWSHVNKTGLSKMQDRAREGIYLGKAPNANGHLVYIPEKNSLITTRNIIFDEFTFPGHNLDITSSASKMVDPIPFPTVPIAPPNFPSSSYNVGHDSSDSNHVPDEGYMDIEVSMPLFPFTEESDDLLLDELTSFDNVPSVPTPVNIETLPIPADIRHESGDDSAPPDALRDSSSVRRSSRIAQMSTKSASGLTTIFLSLVSLCSLFFISLSAVENAIHRVKGHAIFEPKTYKEAIECLDAAEWLESMEREFRTLLANNTFRVVSSSEVPKGRKLLKAKWVYKIKIDSEGNLSSRKSRLVAKGYTEVPGVDFFEIFHPVGQGQTFRLLLTKALCSLMLIFHIDIKGAFLHASLKEVIYMQLPPGTPLTMNGEIVIVRLLKSLYGLKQAGREWYIALSTILISLGFLQSAVDPCLFVHPERNINILAYVDDLLTLCMTKSDFAWLTSELEKHFDLGSAGKAEYYLGQRIRYRRGKWLMLDQTAAIDALLAKYGMADCNPANTPASLDRLLPASPKDEFTDQPFASLVGALLYLSTHTRPDISYSVNSLCSFCASPTEAHWLAAKRVLRYLKGSKDKVIKYTYTPDLVLSAACDSDWAGDWVGPAATARSISGFVIWMAGGVISAKSRKQSVVALSSCEAEYMAISSAVQEIIYIRQILVDLYLRQTSPTILACDNAAAIQLTSNETHQQRAKHISIRYHFNREAVRRREVEMVRTPGVDNPSDLLTKSLGPGKFSQHVDCYVADPEDFAMD